MGHLLSLQYWIPEVAVYEIEFSVVPFWVQLHGLPLGTMTTKNAVKLMEQLGEIVEVENPLIEGQLLRSFMRVRVQLDITQPLVTGCWVPRKDLPKVWIVFKYEKLMDVCFKCGVIGHEQKYCKKERAMSTFSTDVPKYGPTLGVSLAKSLAEVVMEQKSWKKGDFHKPKEAWRGRRSEDMEGSSKNYGSKVQEEEEELKETMSEEHVVPSGEKQKMMRLADRGVGESEVHKVGEVGRGDQERGREENSIGVEDIISIDLTEKEIQKEGTSSGGDDTHDIRKTKWWNAEQVDHPAAYEKLQTDIQSLRDDMAKYWMGKTQKEPPEVLGGSHSLINMDEHQTRPGDIFDSMGPSSCKTKDPETVGPRGYGPSAEESNLVSSKTDMGLKPCSYTERGLLEALPVNKILNKANEQHSVIEPPSPRAEDGSVLSASLSLSELYDCRAACFEEPVSDGETLDEANLLEKKRIAGGKDGKRGNKEEKRPYFIVYPSDEEEDQGGKITKLRDEEEICLADNMSMTLCFKKRKWREGEMSQEKKIVENKRRKDECEGMQFTRSLLLGNSDTDMAEEAGLPMPPLP